MLKDLECLLMPGDGWIDQSNVCVYTLHTCHPFDIFFIHPFLARRLNKNKLQVLPELLFQSTPKLTRL